MMLVSKKYQSLFGTHYMFAFPHNSSTLVYIYAHLQGLKQKNWQNKLYLELFASCRLYSEYTGCFKIFVTTFNGHIFLVERSRGLILDMIIG